MSRFPVRSLLSVEGEFVVKNRVLLTTARGVFRLGTPSGKEYQTLGLPLRIAGRMGRSVPPAPFPVRSLLSCPLVISYSEIFH